MMLSSVNVSEVINLKDLPFMAMMNPVESSGDRSNKGLFRKPTEYFGDCKDEY